MSGALKKPIVAKQSAWLSASCGQQSHQSFWVRAILHAGGCAKRRMQILSWAQTKISSAPKLFPSPARMWFAPSHLPINLTVWFKVLYSWVLVWASWIAPLMSCITHSNVWCSQEAHRGHTISLAEWVLRPREPSKFLSRDNFACWGLYKGRMQITS